MDVQEQVNPAIQTPPPGEAAPPNLEPPVSLADHAAQFDPKRVKEGTAVEPEPVPDGTTPQPPRHRAASQRARAEDVPRIQELTKRLREAEAERDRLKASPAVAAPVSSPAPPAIKADAPAGEKFTFQSYDKFIEAHPEIAADTHSYEAWQDAKLEARDAWRDQQAANARAAEGQTAAHQAVLQSYATKAQDYAKTQPQFFETMKAAAPIIDDIPPLLYQAIVRDDNGPQIAYHLVTHPELLADLHLLTEGKAVSDASVAIVQRRFSPYRVQAVATGSAAAPVVTFAPRPPNPVRTGPMTTGDVIPGDGHSLAEHAKAFGPKSRR